MSLFGGGGKFADSGSFYALSDHGVTLLLCAAAASGIVSAVIAKAGKLLDRKEDTLTGAGKYALIVGRNTAVMIIQAAALLLCTVYLMGAAYNPFLYFRF